MSKISKAILVAATFSLAACGGDAAEVTDEEEVAATDTTEGEGGEAGEGGAEGGTVGAPTVVAEVDYGNDTSRWANDGECDDPRFEGDAMAIGLNTDNIGRDATDCRADVEAGRIALNPLFTEPENYGDDTSDYANDGECDDIRYTGAYSAQMIYLPEDIGHDATDCRAAVEAGTARWQGNSADPARGITSEQLQSMDL